MKKSLTHLAALAVLNPQLRSSPEPLFGRPSLLTPDLLDMLANPKNPMREMANKLMWEISRVDV